MEKDLTQKGQFLRCLIRLGGGGLTPNETLSLSNGKFVFDHGPYRVSTFSILLILSLSKYFSNTNNFSLFEFGVDHLAKSG